MNVPRLLVLFVSLWVGFMASSYAQDTVPPSLDKANAQAVLNTWLPDVPIHWIETQDDSLAYAQMMAKKIDPLRQATSEELKAIAIKIGSGWSFCEKTATGNVQECWISVTPIWEKERRQELLRQIAAAWEPKIHTTPRQKRIMLELLKNDRRNEFEYWLSRRAVLEHALWHEVAHAVLASIGPTIGLTLCSHRQEEMAVELLGLALLKQKQGGVLTLKDVIYARAQIQAYNDSETANYYSIGWFDFNQDRRYDLARPLTQFDQHVPHWIGMNAPELLGHIKVFLESSVAEDLQNQGRPCK